MMIDLKNKSSGTLEPLLIVHNPYNSRTKKESYALSPSKSICLESSQFGMVGRGVGNPRHLLHKVLKPNNSLREHIGSYNCVSSTRNVIRGLDALSGIR